MVNAAYWHAVPAQLHALAALQALAHMFIGVFLYDVLLSLPFDWQLLTGKRRLHWVHLAYAGTRISMLGYSVVVLTLIWAQERINCKDIFYLTEILMGTTVFASSVLLAFRTVCVYEGAQRTLIKAVVTVLALALLGVWMQGVRDILLTWSTTTGNPVWTRGWCVVVSVKSTYWVKYVVTIFFDAVILLLTTVGVVRQAGSASHVGMVLIQQGLAYFVITLLANMVIMTLTLLHLNDVMSLLFAIPQSVTCVICSCRLYRNLVDDLGNTEHVARSPSSGGIKELDSFGNPTTSRSESFIQRLFSANGDLGASRSRGRLPSFVLRDEDASPPFYSYLKQLPPSSSMVVSTAAPLQAAETTPCGHDKVDFEAMLADTQRPSSNILHTMPAAPRAPPSPFTVRIHVEQQQRTSSDNDVEAQR